jgi:hypothetical protein
VARGRPIILLTRTFPTKGAASEFFSEMLRRYAPDDRVRDVDAADLASLLERHPNRDEKIGVGIDHFEVQAAVYATQCFRVVRTDGTWARFSYKTCISPTSSDT